MTTVFFERKKYFIIDENNNIDVIINEKDEYRSFYILFHALYTYYTTVLCLDNCLVNNCFNKTQDYEAKARIGFYLYKYQSDLNRFKKVVDYYNDINLILTKEGIDIFEMIKNKYSEIIKKYDPIIKSCDYKNQPYNFTFNEFIKLNPISND